jgi:hypothetical protein
MAGGEHRSRFRCLPLARIFAASVVATAFAATVVVVLTAGLDPANSRLSVTHGHLQSAGLLWSKRFYTIEHLKRPSNDTIIFYAPAEELTVWLSMDAHDRNADADTTICVSAVHIIDLPHAPSLDGMLIIATKNNMVATGSPYKPCIPWRPRPGSPSRMQLDRWITFNNDDMLCYISQKYGGINDFTVILQVDMMILHAPEGTDVAPANYTTYYCWPVTIGNVDPRRIRFKEAVTCKPKKAIDFGSYASVLNLTTDLTEIQRQICGFHPQQ